MTARRYLISGIAATTLAVGSAAQAQETGSTPAAAQDEHTLGLEEVVVTARKRAENLQKVPIAVTAFGGEELRESGFRNLGDIAAQSPNLQINRDTGGDSSLVACMRGMCRTDTILTEDPLVGIYIDGFYVPKAEGALFDMMDVERIEVLRGPQGTLFGKNTLGGAISVTSAAPTGQFGGAANVGVGSDGLFSGRFSVDAPLIADRLSAKFSYLRTKRDGLIEDTAGNDMKDIDNQGARLALRLTANEKVTVDFVSQWFESKQGVDIYQATYVEPGVEFISPTFVGMTSIASPNFLSTRTTIPPGAYDDLDMKFNGLTVTADVNDAMTFKSLTGYRKTEGDTMRLWSEYIIISGRQLTEQEFFSQEFQLLGSALNDRLKYVTGLYYSNEKGTFLQGLAFSSLDIGTQIDLSVENKSYAGFGEVTYDFTDKVSLSGGVRYTKEEREADLLNRTIDGSIILSDISGNAPSNKFETSALAPRASFQFKPNENVMTFFTYSRGFKSGGLNGRANRPEEFTSYDDTKSNSFELGVKSTLWDSRARFNATYFQTKVDDLQVQVNSFDAGSGAFLTKITNAGKATIQGVELEAHAQLARNFEVNGMVGYTNPKYDQFLAFNNDFANPGFVDVANNRNFQFAPKWVYNIGARYQHNLGSLGTLISRLDYSHVDDQYFQVIPSDRVAGKAYGLLDARFELAGLGANKQIDVAIWGKNLTDEEYRTGGFDIPTLGLPGGGDGLGFNSFGDPRTYGLEVRYNFGSGR